MANEQNLKKFSSTYQPKHNGRKPKLYTTLSKEYKISREDFTTAYSTLINKPIEGLKAIGDDKKTPSWIVMLCHAIYKDIQKGTMYSMQEVADRLFGKSGQSIDVTSNGKSITHEPIIVKIIDKREQLEDNGDTNN